MICIGPSQQCSKQAVYQMTSHTAVHYDITPYTGYIHCYDGCGASILSTYRQVSLGRRTYTPCIYMTISSDYVLHMMMEGAITWYGGGGSPGRLAPSESLSRDRSSAVCDDRQFPIPQSRGSGSPGTPAPGCLHSTSRPGSLCLLNYISRHPSVLRVAVTSPPGADRVV